MSWRPQTVRTITTFERFGVPVTRRFRCADCGRRCSRSKTFTQTLNPFNKTATGDVKTADQILDELHASADAWHPTVCARCEHSSVQT